MAQHVYLSLGSNLGDRAGNLRYALGALEPSVLIFSVSSVYETAPVGVTDQPAFLNIAVGGTTDLDPHELLRWLKHVEVEAGRKPTYRWGPRVVDIDILLYDALVLAEPDLSIPHKEMTQRAFALVPLAEIAPDVQHPQVRTSISALRDAAPGLAGVRRVGSARLLVQSS